MFSHVNAPKPKGCLKFYVVTVVNFVMKQYNNQSNAQVFNLLIYLLLPYMFQAFF
jgi:hypothetical protein